MAIMQNKSWIFFYATLLHLVWGIVLLVSPNALQITAIASIVGYGVTSAAAAGWFYLTVTFLAILGILCPKPAGFFFLLPQQIALSVSAFGALEAMAAGQFADGVIRSSAFLVADQSPAIIALILHTLALWTSLVKD